ncbi:MAG TPA: hypothetical protein VF929_11680 [Gemmatimonadaceae bacterium]
MKTRLTVTALLSALAPMTGIAAQQRAVPQRPQFSPSGRATTQCAGQRIDSIYVFSDAPTVQRLQRVPALARIARDVHVVTRPELIRRYLLLEPGAPCTEIRRAESERILRAQPFIAEADVVAVPNDDGGVDLEVRTTDETSMVLGGSFRARAPMVSALLLGNANIAGGGVFGALSWRYGEGLRDAVAIRVTDNQFLGQVMVSTVEGERSERGGRWRMDLLRPYYTDLQRLAWRAQAGASTQYAELRRPDDLRPSVMVRRNFFDVGSIARVGAPGRLGLLGASVTGVDEQTGDRLTTVDSGIVSDVGALPRNYPAHRVARLNLLAGVRYIQFVRRTGLDALTATEDVPLGVQIGTLFGRSVRAFGSREDDLFASADLYASSTSGVGVLRLQARGEARRVTTSDNWDGILTSARLSHVLQFSASHQNQFRLEWSGTYRQRTPIQLLFGIIDGGVRGFEDSPLAGGQRLVGHVDERFLMGRPFNLADVGIAAFADAGRQWAGDVPFGVTTSIKGSLGFGLLAALPPRSGRLWRADVALPLGSGANSRWTVSITNADRVGFVYREPGDVADAREPTVPRSVFAWP